MAYLESIVAKDSQPIAGLSYGAEATPDFSPLEWSVIRLARSGRLWTIRPPGRARRFLNWVMGRGTPQLANPRLEALRRIAVLSWNFGFTVPSGDVAAFLSAGFSPAQYELLVSSVSRARGAPISRQATEVFA